MSRWFFVILTSLTLVDPASAGTAIGDAVVQVEGCSGVCVDPSGLVLTARHCRLPETVTVRFRDRTVTAHRIHQCDETEGPVVYDCAGDGYPFRPVAATPPRVGERVWTYGYPQGRGRRELAFTSGPLLRWSTFEYAGGHFNGNVVRCVARPGWSGGPLINGRGEVCGLLSSCDQQTSVFIGWSAVRDAVTAAQERIEASADEAQDERPTLSVFGSVSCGPCRQFRSDFADPEFAAQLQQRFRIEFVDVDKRPDVARRFGVTEVPTFLVPGGPRVTGYVGRESLLNALGIRDGLTDRPPPERTVVPGDSEESEAGKTSDTNDPEHVETEVADRESSASAAHGSETATSTGTSETESRLDRLNALLQTALSLTTVLGATGGAAGLIAAGLAAWNALRRHRRRTGRTGRDPPDAPTPEPEPPPTVSVDAPPPPQAIVPETRFAPYERDTFAEAFAWAEAELARKYPGSVGTLESLRGLIDQYLAARGYRPPASGNEP
ncbi:trypsin-like peptidase domain-containing protein [Maioricimonas sp. JC845]|uniref:trypsin-like peptidase domain-containing protein n=1 Tax=Maioricimonas sp. JC845 TaxID=3232138 RepID=UPI00345B17B4